MISMYFNRNNKKINISKIIHLKNIIKLNEEKYKHVINELHMELDRLNKESETQ